MIAIIVHALYGLTTSAEHYRTLFADFLRGLGFVPTRYDRDVWMRLRESGDGYDYICTHVDDFKIVAKDPERWMEMIKGTFLVKESGERDYYLGNNYKYHSAHDVWTMGSTTFALESIRHVESVHGVLRKFKTPLPASDSEGGHPETDTSPLLDTAGHRQYQHLLGMLQWLVTIGHPDLCHAVASLNRFSSCPCEQHLQLTSVVSAI
jgi:Reverse transcriptase (RNA-dependent DNA polymerase).